MNITKQIKICGITNPEDAIFSIKAGATLIGINRCKKSPRFCRHELAISIIQSIGLSPIVAVYADMSVDEIVKDASQLGIKIIQVYGCGDTDIQYMLHQGFEVIQAMRVSPNGRVTGKILSPVILLDNQDEDGMGGSGKTLPWSKIPRPNVQFFIAGGLNPKNVGEAIRILKPAGVDVASGVESSPKIKDHAKIESFITTANIAFCEVK